MTKTLTDYEKISLQKVYNLSDGHARQDLSPTQSLIIQQLPQIYQESQLLLQNEVEDRMKKSFFSLAFQDTKTSTSLIENTLLCHSSSAAIEIIGNFLGKRCSRVALIEPTFDSIPRILVRLGSKLVPISEVDIMESDTLYDTIDKLEADAIFLVCPNNPTGFTLTKDQFHQMALACSATQTILVVDFAFRFYSSHMYWDQYSFASSIPELDYIFIEDTGKTWPTLDIRIGMLSCSKGIYNDIESIHNDYLLNISPLILNILYYFIEDTIHYGVKDTVLRTSEVNRIELRSRLENLPLRFRETTLNIEWVELRNEFNCNLIYRALKERSVHILPGDKFFWKNKSQGTNYIRFALAREPKMFKEASSIIAEILNNLLV